jgi:hypothetical protein
MKNGVGTRQLLIFSDYFRITFIETNIKVHDVHCAVKNVS